MDKEEQRRRRKDETIKGAFYREGGVQGRWKRRERKEGERG